MLHNCNMRCEVKLGHFYPVALHFAPQGRSVHSELVGCLGDTPVVSFQAFDQPLPLVQGSHSVESNRVLLPGMGR